MVTDPNKTSFSYFGSKLIYRVTRKSLRDIGAFECSAFKVSKDYDGFRQVDTCSVNFKTYVPMPADKHPVFVVEFVSGVCYLVGSVTPPVCKVTGGEEVNPPAGDATASSYSLNWQGAPKRVIIV